MLKQYLFKLSKGNGLPIKHKVYASSVEEAKSITKEVWGDRYNITSIWERVDVSNNGDKARTSNGTNSCD